MATDITKPHPDSAGSDAYKAGRAGEFDGLLNEPYIGSHIDRAMNHRAVQEERDRLLRLVPDMYSEIKYNRAVLTEMAKEGLVSNA